MGSATSFNTRLADAFAVVIDLPADDRCVFLDRLAATDPTLRQALDRLLAADVAIETGAADDPLIGPVAAERAVRHSAVFPGFDVLRPLGSGTAGTVYEAQQRRPNRRVAIKLLHDAPLPTTAEDFWHEADVLGRVRHPGVAQVYAADATPDGRCYLVMELVEGSPITEHAAQRSLATAECVRLVVQVCDAIEAVHRLGVVHRDLKPGNVLVEDGGRAKIVDFGVAVVTTQAQADAAPAGSTLVGTLAYMSPERLTASATLAAIDARSDVYSIGVLLYELLTRRLPIDLRGVPLSEVATRVNAARPLPIGQIVPSCRGDLEAVVARAMDKDPAVRYPSAVALADDLRRYLSHRPVEARRRTAFGRAMKFARRHRTASVIAVAAVVLLATVTTALQWVERTRQRSYTAMDAERRQKQFTAQAGLYESLINLAASAAQAGQPVRAAALLNEAAVRTGDGPDLRGWEWHYLWRDTHPAFASFENRHVEGRCVAVSPDSRQLASGGGGDKRVLIHDLGAPPPRRPRLELAGHTGLVMSVDFSPDGRELLSAGFDGRVLRWDTATGKPLPSPALGTNMQSMGATFRPDGRFYAVATSHERLLVLDARDNSEALELTLPGRYLSNQPAWSPDGTRLAVSDNDGVLHVWTVGPSAAGGLASYGPPVDLPGTGGWQSAVVFDPTGRTLAASCGDGTVRVWDLASRSEKLVLRGHDTWVTDVAFSRDGKRLASSSRDQTVRLWDTQTGAALRTFGGHSAWAMAVTFDAAGHVVSAGFGSEVFRWTGDEWNDRAVDRHDMDCAALSLMPSPTGDNGVTVIDRSGEVFRLDNSSDALTPATQASPASRPAVEGAVFALRPGGRQSLRAIPGQTPRLVSTGPGGSADAGTALPFITAPVIAAAFDPAGGPELAVAAADRLHLVRAGDGLESAGVAVPPGTTSVAVAPGASRVAVAGVKLTLLSFDGGRLVPQSVTDLRGRALALTFAADGRRVAVTDALGHCDCVDADTGATLWSISIDPADVTSLAFSPDGRRLLTATGEGTVHVRDAATGRALLTLRDSEQIRVMSVGWSTDGASAYAINYIGQLFRWRAFPESATAETR